MSARLKLYVWEGDGVLEDYTSGMIAVLASDLGEALAEIRKACPYAMESFPPDRYEVVESPKAFVCWGGG